MTVAVSKAVEDGREGDHLRLDRQHVSASAAAYAARAGITCAVLVPQGKIALGKLAQALVHGARLLQVAGNFDDCLALASKLAHRLPGGAGQLGQPRPPARPEDRRVRDRRGARRRARTSTACRSATPATSPRTGWATARTTRPATRPGPPKMYGFQAAGAAPIVTGQVVRRAVDHRHRDPDRQPGIWTKALDARDASGGLIDAVTDREILSAYRLLAREVGVFVELGSAASVAGLLQRPSAGLLPRGSTVVCTVTGHGLKDPEWAISTAPAPTTMTADVLAAARALDLA